MEVLIAICATLLGGALGFLIGYEIGKKAMLEKLKEKEV